MLSCSVRISEASGSWCSCSTIRLTSGLVTLIEASYSEDEVSFKASHAHRDTKEVALYFSVNVWPVTADVRTSLIARSSGSNNSAISGNVLRKYVQRCRRPNDNDNDNTEGAEVLCMRMFGIAQNMVGLIQNNRKQWKTVLTTGGEALGEVHITRGIFQGDSLSSPLFSLMQALTLVLRKVKAGYDPGDGKGMINHLLFMDDLKKPYGKNENQVDSLVPSVRIVAEDMPMEFGIPKCAILLMKRGKVFQSEEIMLPGNNKMRSLNVYENENYNYLGVLEADDVKHSKMKDSIQKEYFRTVKTILNSIREIR